MLNNFNNKYDKYNNYSDSADTINIEVDQNIYCNI